MPTTAEYERLISGYGWEELQNLWAMIEAGQATGWEPGKALEYLVLRAFQLGGAQVRWPYSVWEDGQEVEQIDGAVYWQGLSCLLECKDESRAINVEPIAKMRNQLLRRPGGSIGLVFSRRGFTASAITLARFVAPQTILLWDDRDVSYTILKRDICSALLVKYRKCVEEGSPVLDISGENL